MGGTATVTFIGADGERRAKVDVDVAVTREERKRGLGGVDSLQDDSGMLFVYEDEAVRRYVMRDMLIPLDMVFVASSGDITEIHHAELPPAGAEDDELEQYAGVGKWVVELPYHWTTDNEVTTTSSVTISGMNG